MKHIISSPQKLSQGELSADLTNPSDLNVQKYKKMFTQPTLCVTSNKFSTLISRPWLLQHTESSGAYLNSERSSILNTPVAHGERQVLFLVHMVRGRLSTQHEIKKNDAGS